MRVVMATNNAHKLEEVQAIVGPLGLEVGGLDAWPDMPEAPETSETFEGNALDKARFVHERIGGIVVADDSGIEIEALGWAPGVRSKRWTPEATTASNNAKLLRELQGNDNRRARYRCALAVVCEAGERTADGTCWGTIGHEARGTGGFGYDPLFWPDAYPGRTMAEVSPEEKNAVSHRGLSFRELPRLLSELGLV